ncbi:related to PDR16 protein [Phialocephala subalpina]|uniref:Related to PDR16 protein n=1 Tax=Phialocephala subalpina TaxID=576137 RepID=A0A1L7WWP7_9HELO|nr:related to PDR16 protein [Phialocephala subalpina]
MAAALPLAETALEEKLAEVKLESNATLPVPNAETSNTSSVTASLREKVPGPLKTPIVDPVESAIVPPPAELSSEHKSKYESLLEIVKTWKEIPSTQSKGGPITDSEIMWLTRECLLRYLRATKWVTAEAAKRLLGTLTWRREYGVQELTGERISPENETGKQIIFGFDIAGRPCHYLNPGRQNTEPSPRQVQHLVFMVERVINLMVPGQETLALLINFKSSKSRSNTAPGIGQGREVLNILQTHYPERLGRALIINVPWIVNGFFKLITPFIDPLTRQKLKFNDDMRQHVPPEQLWNEFHGDLEFEYEHDVYWPALLKLCEEKHSEQVARWEKAGKNYGESEAYIKGGNEPSVTASAEKLAEPPAAATLASDEKVAGGVKSEENVAPGSTEPTTEEKVPIQSNGAQSNGNMDVLAVKPDPVVTTEGDRA